jgi:hypothetical protein
MVFERIFVCEYRMIEKDWWLGSGCVKVLYEHVELSDAHLSAKSTVNRIPSKFNHPQA